ncbi:MAG: protoporphyrinogen oxidase [Proteobacteria bacterium]|nr:protoporphyrinogen oxidase [Pseudomonadota bacterium]
MASVIVIGGGISGMAVAYRLKRDHRISVTVLESADRPGGKAQTEVADEFTCEEATNGWLDKEQAMRDLIRSLALETRVQPSDPAAGRRFIFRNGALREIKMHPLKFMTSSVLPLGARFRLAIEPLIKKGPSDKDETLQDFAVRRLGRGALDILVGPMASGVYAGDPSRMSLKACFGKVSNLEQQHGGLIKGMIALKKAEKAAGRDPSIVQAGPSGRLTSFKGGMAELVQALAHALGSDLRTGCRVIGVTPYKKGGFEVTVEGHDSLRADAVISAAPAWAATSFLKTLDEDAAGAFGEIPYPALDVICLGFRRDQVIHDLNGFGFLVPRGQGKTILGSLWTSSIFPGRAPEDFVLIRAMIGGMLESQVAGWTDNQVIDTVRSELENILGIPASLEPIFKRLYRHKKAIPQYHIGHGDLIDRIQRAEERHRGFFAAGNAINGIGVVDCVRESVPMANRVAALLKKKRP